LCVGGVMVLVVDAGSRGTARSGVVRGQAASGRVAPAAASPPSMNASLGPRLLGASAARRALLTSRASGLGFTANALVSANAASLSRPQAEPSIASDPLNRNVMVVGYADSVTDVFPGVSRSTDGGKSWRAPTGGALLPSPPGLSWGDRTSVGHIAGGDSALAWGTGDTVYFATLGNQDNTKPPTSGVCNVGGLYVYRSTDGGNTWTLPVNGPALPNTQTIFRDRDHIAADSHPSSSHAGTVYLAWSDDQYAGCPHNFGANFVTRQIMFSRSTDGGVSWSTPISLGSGCLEAAIPAVGADGSVYVAWFDCNIRGGDRELVRKSTDGGASFSPAVAAGSGLARCPDPLPGARFRLSGEAAPTIATDPTDAARVYVAWSSCTPAAQADVFLSRSTDGGATWSSPLRVNDDGTSNPRDQFFPAITVDDQGVVRAMWGDDRLDTVNPGGHNYDIFAAASTDHGASFGANVRVTTQSSDPDVDNGGTFIGDYWDLAPCGTPVWGDTRNGNQDIYAAGLDQNGDGIVDDCVTGPPVNTVSPTISGAASKGATLNGSPGAWKGFPLPTFAVRWRRCDTRGRGCVDIAGATSDSYTLVGSDAGKTIRFRVSGTNSLGSAAADSTQTAVVPGTPKCVVPMLIGAKLAPAKATIRKQHCRVGKLSYVRSTNKKKGRVVKQRPAPGKQLKNGTTVDLWIGQ
jgi:PASTA domain